MPKQVESPVTRRGSKVGSPQPLSPGAKSMPGGSKGDSVPAQPAHVSASRVAPHAEEPTPLKQRPEFD
jgi:hypothetical protein